MTGNLQVGQLVCSKAGRDQDRYFIVIRVNNDNLVQIADGDLRKVDSSKKKNVKHLHLTQAVSFELAQRILAGEKISDRDVQRAIWGLEQVIRGETGEHKEVGKLNVEAGCN